MKSLRLLLIPAIVLLMVSCGNEEAERLQSINEELKDEMRSKEEAVKDLLAGLEGVQEDLREITQREDLLGGMTVNNAELARSPQLQIMEDISLVDGLIKRNQSKINNLELRVKGSQGKLYEFERVVSNLKLDLLDKESEMNLLKSSLIELEEDYVGLLSDYNEQLLISSIQDKALHEAYFAYGSKQELQEMDVADKEGGILGLGSSWKLKDDFNKDYFTAVDIRQVNRIPMESSDVKIISTHPADAYELVIEEDTVKELLITDSDRFWKTSKYLAVIVD
jgi:hypothetical protein